MAKRKRKNIFETEPLAESKLDDWIIEEINILGAMMIDNIFMLWCAKYRTTVDMFEHEEAKLLFTAIDSLRKERAPVDLLTVSEKLRQTGLIERITPVTLANMTAIADVKRAYTSMKKRIKVLELPVYDISEEIVTRKKDEYKTIINFDENIEFRHFVERFKMWVNNQEIQHCLQRLGSPETSVNDRQFCAGVLFAVKRFEAIFDFFIENEAGDNLGIQLSDLINQHDDWKKGEKARRKEAEAVASFGFERKVPDDIPF
jgi:hypothetical protein